MEVLAVVSSGNQEMGGELAYHKEFEEFVRKERVTEFFFESLFDLFKRGVEGSDRSDAVGHGGLEPVFSGSKKNKVSANFFVRGRNDAGCDGF